MSSVTRWGGLRAGPAPTALAAGGFALAASTTALAGCTTAAPPPPSPPAVTVTVSSAPTTPATVTASAPASAVSGRHYDVGTIVGFSTDGDSTVLTLDRWTVDGVSDATLARDGIPITPDPGRRFRDVNKIQTYPVPVAPDIIIVINTCLPSSDPLQPDGMNSRPVHLHDFLTMPNREQVISILTYSGGEAVRLETDPRC